MYGVRRARVAPAALAGGRSRRPPSPAVNTATGPTGNERQAPPQHPPVQQGDHTATSTHPVVAALLGGSQALPTSRHVNPFARRISAVSARQGAPPDRAACEVGMTFSSEDHPANLAGSGALPLLCTPTICQVAVTRTLVDGGAGLSVLSVETFNHLCIPRERLQPSRSFSGVGGGSSDSLGQIRLRVTFGTYDNFCTEMVDFDIAPIGLPYNAILGYPALAQFMAATHPAYNLMKMPGSSGTLTVHRDTGDALRALKLTFKTAASAQPIGAGTPEPKGAAPTKKKPLLTQDKAETRQIPIDKDGSSSATFTIGANLGPEQEEALVKFLRASKKVFAWEPD